MPARDSSTYVCKGKVFKGESHPLSHADEFPLFSVILLLNLPIIIKFAPYFGLNSWTLVT